MEQFHGRTVGGRPLRLDIAEDRPRAPRQRRDFNENRGGGRGRDSGRGRDFARPDPASPPEPDYGRNDYRDSYDRDEYRDDDAGGRGGRSFDKPKRPKGSRRGLRGKKRSL